MEQVWSFLTVGHISLICPAVVSDTRVWISNRAISASANMNQTRFLSCEIPQTPTSFRFLYHRLTGF